ncbi:MAG TPA: hypothetical protein VH682_21935 [Gemmataceae bacterium]
MTGLAPSKLVPDLCLLRYRISTTSPKCQAYFDQGLGYFYSYVWMEAARSFETALQYDPECPMAWWGLSRALERWGKGNQTEALLKASKLQARASHREQQLILASMQEKGHAPDAGDEESRKRRAITNIMPGATVRISWKHGASLPCKPDARRSPRRRSWKL